MTDLEYFSIQDVEVVTVVPFVKMVAIEGIESGQNARYGGTHSGLLTFIWKKRGKMGGGKRDKNKQQKDAGKKRTQ